MADALSRRDFLQVTGAGAFASAAPPHQTTATQAPRRRREGPLRLCDRPMRWVQLTLVENDPGRFDPQFWLDYFRRLHGRRRSAASRRHRRLLPHRRSAPPSQRMAGKQRSVRHACRRLSRPEHERRRQNGSARRARRRAGGASGLDRRLAHWRAAAALGEPRPLGDLRARTLQLRLHGPRAPRDRHQVRRGRHLRQPLGAARRRLPASTCVRNFRDATGQALPQTTDARVRSAASISSGAKRD